FDRRPGFVGDRQLRQRSCKRTFQLRLTRTRRRVDDQMQRPRWLRARYPRREHRHAEDEDDGSHGSPPKLLEKSGAGSSITRRNAVAATSPTLASLTMGADGGTTQITDDQGRTVYRYV